MVLVVFDEFPSDDAARPRTAEIDAARYPNFAALARERPPGSATRQTVYDSTFKAVPAILDARMPRRGTAPDVRSHQPSVFHLMNKLGYDVIKVESGTALCPPWICPEARTRRPGVLKRLAGGGRPARLHKWIGAIRDRSRPTFYFQHALLPHEPWIYLPSGRQSRPPGNDPIEGINRAGGFDDPRLTDHNHLRHLLQVGYTDHQLGLIMQRMRRTGIFDRALFIVVADHGIAFEVGVKERRQVTETNFEQVAAVPFFVKAPGQTEGRVDDHVVRNLDVVPTVADLLAHAGVVAARRTLGLLGRRAGALDGVDDPARLQPRDLVPATSSSAGATSCACGALASTAPAPRASCCSATPGPRPTGSARTRS